MSARTRRLVKLSVSNPAPQPGYRRIARNTTKLVPFVDVTDARKRAASSAWGPDRGEGS